MLSSAIAGFLVDLCYNNYKGTLARLNLLTLYSRLQHFVAIFLINVFKSKFYYSSTFDFVRKRIPTRKIRDPSALVNRNFKVSPSRSCVSAASGICRDINMLPKITFR
jgi:hypothetical protein